MILSKRERYAGIIAVVVIGGCALYYYAVDPLWQSCNDARTQIATKKETLDGVQKLIQSKPRLQADWKAKVDAGLSFDEPTAGKQLNDNVQDWAQATGFNLASFKQERTEQDKQFKHIVYRATGKGPERSITQFVYRIQTARIPVKITEMQISSQKDGTDDLQLQVSISTIYLAPDKREGRSEGTTDVRRPAGAKS